MDLEDLECIYKRTLTVPQIISSLRDRASACQLVCLGEHAHLDAVSFKRICGRVCFKLKT